MSEKPRLQDDFESETLLSRREMLQAAAGVAVGGIVGSACSGEPVRTAEKKDFWDIQRRGANFFNEQEEGRFNPAKQAGVQWVRLTPSKWKGSGRDFLLGDADNYTAISAQDMEQLRKVLDSAAYEKMPVVLTMLSLPGARWQQHHGAPDYRIYQDKRYQDQAILFYRDLVRALRGHPALVGYNLLNEPHPERLPQTSSFDLWALYDAMVSAIREEDKSAWIMLDAGHYAAPKAFRKIRPIHDNRVLYSFHFYEPWGYINHEQRGQYSYPGFIPAENTDKLQMYDKSWLWEELRPVREFQRITGVESNRICVGEFGCPRTHPGAAKWLRDAITLFNAENYHWAFYAYREDSWHAMDYELGTSPLPAGYWEAKQKGQPMELQRVKNPLWEVVHGGLVGKDSRL